MDESFPDGSHLADTLNAKTKAGSRGGLILGLVSLALPGPLCLVLLRGDGRDTSRGGSLLCSVHLLMLACVPKLASLSEL